MDAQTPCRAEFCSSGQVCVQTTMMCQATVAGCTPADCGASTAGIGSTPQSCVTISRQAGVRGRRLRHVHRHVPRCRPATTSRWPTAPRASGSSSTTGRAATWSASRTRAARGTRRSSTGRRGRTRTRIASTRATSASARRSPSTSRGDWHVSYVNGWTEALQYLMVPAGNLSKPLAPEVVDDRHRAGRHALTRTGSTSSATTRRSRWTTAGRCASSIRTRRREPCSRRPARRARATSTRGR